MEGPAWKLSWKSEDKERSRAEPWTVSKRQYEHARWKKSGQCGLMQAGRKSTWELGDLVGCVVH